MALRLFFETLHCYILLTSSDLTYTQPMDITKRNVSIFSSNKFIENSKTEINQPRFSETDNHTVCKVLSILN